jgi:WD40 repeat protein
VHGVDELPDGRLFSWAAEGDIRIWNQVGEPSKEGPGRQWESKVLGNHEGWVSHVWPVGQDRLLSLGHFDETMVMWEASPEAQVPMNRSEFVFKMKNGGIIVGEEDGQLTIRTGEYGEHSQSLSGHTDGVSGALELSDGRLLTWSRDCTLRLWDLTRGKQARLLTGHRRPVTGALELRDGNILSWSKDRSLRIWNAHQNRQPEELLGHEGPVDGALELSDGKIFSWANRLPLGQGWSKMGTAPIVWKPSSRQPFMRLPEDMEIREAFALDNGRVLIKPEDGPYTILRTDSQYSERAELEQVSQFVALSKMRLIYRTVGGELIEWNLATDDYPMRHFHGHCSSLHGASALDKKHLLTWGDEGLVQLWDYSRKRLLAAWNVATLTSEDNIGWPHYSVSDAEIPLQWLAVPRVTRDGSTIGEEERHCDLLQVRGALRLVSRWCHNDFLQVLASSEKGYLVVQTTDGVFWLHLYRGNRRVTVQEVIQ